METRDRIETLKDTIQEAIAQGATSVEEIHQHIAKMPLDAVEALGLLGDKPGQVRKLQERSIGAIYDAIRKVNTEVGQLISDQFGNLENIDKVRENIAKRNREALK